MQRIHRRPTPRPGSLRARCATLAVLLGLALSPARARAQACVGDCNADGEVTIAEIILGVNIALDVAPLSACSDFDADGSGDVSIAELITAVGNGLQGCAAETLAFVTATDFQTGGFATASLDEPRTVDPVAPARQLGSDPVPRTFAGGVYVINRSPGDNIQALDPGNGFATRWQCSTGNGSNPQDFALLDAGKAYVTLFAEPDLLVVNPSPSPDCHDFLRSSIDLSAYADSDGVPEMDQMAIVDGILYVSLQRLNNFAPAAPGAIVAVDTATERVVNEFDLGAENPFGNTKGLTVRNGDLLVGEVGAFGTNDGGVERIALPSGQSKGFIVTEEALGGDINDFAVVSDRLAYALVALPDFSTSVVAFDPGSGAVTSTLLAHGEFYSDIEVNDRGELYVVDRTFANPGLRVFRAADGTELTANPLRVGDLPPFQLVFLR
jgi:hypothetical protein